MLHDIINDVKRLKEQQRNSEYQFQQTITSDSKRRQRIDVQSEDLLGMHVAVVVDTIDPLKQGRVRFYTPYLNLETTSKDALPWASPISPFGGFDDSGAIWVPPAGSKIVVFFLHGSRDAAFYIGTIWHRWRGTGSAGHLAYWNNYPNKEYDCLWEGRRNGYLVGDNTGAQVLPPWNTEMYNGYDIDSITDFYEDSSQYNSITYPHIKGYKTEGKHGMKLVDGDPRCNRRYTRAEWFTGRSNIILMKDDHLHPAGQYAFGSNGDLAYCHLERESGDGEFVMDTPKEFPCCDIDCPTTPTDCNVPCVPPGCLPKTFPTRASTHSSVDRTTRFANPFYKRREEMRFYEGAPTPMRNRCELDQSGIQLQSLSGHQMVFDDSVNQPTGVPTWDRDFDFGCDDTFRGKIFIRSATGHEIKISDAEDVGEPRVRGEDNGISMRTATGVFFEMNDETETDEPGVPKWAGPRRGITMMTPSTHLFQMNDHRHEHASEVRLDGALPEKADEPGYEGYVLLRSGYGTQILMRDMDRQDKTVNQFLQIMTPQTDNLDRGPHMLVMQDQESGPGLVMLRAGGVFYTGCYDDSIEVVGVEENPANKFTTITDNYFVDVKNTYFNHNDLTIYYSESYIFLMAGKDCQAPDDADKTVSETDSTEASDISAALSDPGSTAGKSCAPCLYNVIVAKDPWVCPLTGYVHYGIKADQNGDIVMDSRSNRVYASAGQPSGTESCSGGSEDSTT
jgi:hypothetical protein